MRRVITVPAVAAACTSPPARAAVVPSDAATDTAGAAPPGPSSQDTLDESTVEALRPRTWGDCLEAGWGDGEPCPWVGCTMHLLLDVSDSTWRGEGLVLNVQRRRRGRLRVIRPRTEDEVDAFVDQAVGELFTMEHTCARRCGPLSIAQLGRALRITEEPARQLVKRALVELRGQGVDLEAEVERARERRGSGSGSGSGSGV